RRGAQVGVKGRSLADGGAGSVLRLLSSWGWNVTIASGSGWPAWSRTLPFTATGAGSPRPHPARVRAARAAASRGGVRRMGTSLSGRNPAALLELPDKTRGAGCQPAARLAGWQPAPPFCPPALLSAPRPWSALA